MNKVDVDLVAYLALSEVADATEDVSISEDLASKMFVHSKRLSLNNPNIKLRI